LATDWLAGGQPDWQAIAPDQARRVPIPGYPFARESYWPPLEAASADGLGTALHPLAGANRATLYSQKYAARLEPGFALLRDHQVAGHGILPATAYLEWARAAGSLAAEQDIAVLADIVWQRPLLAGAKSVDIQALLEPQGDGVRFELCSGAEAAPVLHAQGWLSLETPAVSQDGLDLAAMRSRLPAPWSEERCYGFFAELGLNYGAGFRVLREVAFNEREALGRLQLAVADPAYVWQPALLDGLLQTGAVLMAGYGEKGLLLPHALARISVFRPLAASGWAHIRLLEEPSAEGAALNLDYYDETGNLLARMEGLQVRPMAAAPVRPPQPDSAGLIPSTLRQAQGERNKPEPLKVKPFVLSLSKHERLNLMAVPQLVDSEPAALAFRRCWEEASGVADARAPNAVEISGVSGPSFRQGMPESRDRDVTGRVCAPSMAMDPGIPCRGDDPRWLNSTALASAPGILICDQEGALFRALADAGVDCRRVEFAANRHAPQSGAEGIPTETVGTIEQWQDLASTLAAQPPGCLLAYFPASSSPAAILQTCAALLRSLGSTLARRRIPLLLAYGYTLAAPCPGLDGFARSAMQEYGGLSIRVLGLAGDPVDYAQEIVAELGRDDFHVRLDGSRRVAGLQALELPAQQPDLTGTTWLITGAGGALGRLMAEALAARGCRLALTGRRAPDEALQAFLATQQDRAFYHACDLADADAVAELIAETRRRFGPIHGLLHTAGTTADALIARKTAEQMEAVLAGKLEAAYRLDACLAEEAELRWFVLFGSLAGVTGNIGQADYAYANAGLAHFAAWREGLRAEGRRQGFSLCLEWPYWRDGGMRLDERTLAFVEKQTGLVPLPTDLGLELFFRSLALEGGAVGFAYGEAERIGKLLDHDRSHALRGNAAPDALRPVSDRTAERWEDRSHAERGSDPSEFELARLIEDRLLDLASAILKIDKAQFDPEDPMDAYGFDSINLNALAHELGEQYGIELQPATFFEYPTLRAYAAYLARDHRAAIAAKLLPDAVPETRHPTQEPAGDAVFSTSPSPQPSPGGRGGFAPPAPGLSPRRRAFRLGANVAPEPIAVVGLSAILPGADDLGEFWAALESGLDLVSEIPQSRWDWRLWHGSLAEGKTPVKRAGFMKRVDGFDAAFFGISPKEAALMDPQHRLFLQAAWHAIEDAGHKPSDFQGRKVGLFVGVSSFDYQEILRAAPDGVHAHELTGNAHSILANRVSYWLNLRGPSEPVDTACSSSLVAVHRAIRAIRAGECEMALAGGVNVLLSPLVQLAFAKAGMLSPDGRCKTFDAAADGYVRGEGVGALLLKPLSLAQRDGNPIDALILGSAVNHGGRAHHLVAPNPKAQAEVVAAAVADAGVDPRSIGYIEVHGTGTALGDPIEINGLKLAFGEMLGQAPTDTPFCALGSVKTQIGHLEAAAGVAGLAKLLLCFRHGRLPGNRQLQQLNPQIQLANSPFYLPKDNQDWQRCAIDGRLQPRRAGISSFGFGGVNAHLVLEEAPASIHSPLPPGEGSGVRVFPFSAKDEPRLRALVDAFLALDPLPDLPSMAYTLQIGREAMPQRLAVIADSPAELRRKLQRYRDGLADADVLPGNPADAGLLSSLLDEEEGENFVATLFKTGKLRKLARFWAAGLEVDWARAYLDAKPARVHLPGYPFAETRYWAVEGSPWGGEQERRVGDAHQDAPSPASAYQNAPSPANAGQRWAVPTLQSPAAAFLRERLAQVAGFDPATLDPQADLSELGLDSILAMELLRDIEAAYGLLLFPSELVEHNSLAALAAHIERELGNAPSNCVEVIHRGSSPRQGMPGSMAMDGAQTRPVKTLATLSLSLDFGSAAAAVGIPCRNDGFEAPLNSTTSSPSPGSRAPALPMVFLLSTPRAGSTLLRAMLMGHSRLFAPPELHLLPFADLAERQRIFEQEGKSFLGEGLLQALCALDELSPETAKEQVARWIEDAMPVAAVYGYFQERLGQRILIDKSPSYAQSLEVLQRAEQLQPAPRYIQLIRHPLAVAHSFVRNRFHRLLGAEEAPWPLALRLWDEYNGHLDAFLAKLPPERVFRLHFEDLVAAPEAATRALCGWLGVEFEPALCHPYRGERLTQGLHAQSLPIGDPNFHRHERIEPELAAVPAEAWEQLPQLGGDGVAHALRWGYCLDSEPAPLAPAQAAFLAGRKRPLEELLIYRAAWPETAVDEAALAWAWRRVLRKHLALRHAFFLEDGVWRQQPMPASEPVFVVVEEDGDSAVQLVEALRREFDSQAGRLAGCGLARHGDGSATLALVVHHLVADGVSLALLGRDLLAAYRQPCRDLPAVDDRFRRYAELVQQAPLPLADLPAWQRHIATPFAGSQAPAWEPGLGSSSFQKSATARASDGNPEPLRQAQDRLPLPSSQAGAWERAGTRDAERPEMRSGSLSDSASRRLSHAERGNDVELSLSPAELGLSTAPAETRHRRLLAALLQTLAEWTGQSEPVIALRRHGRSGPLAEPFHDVVGWFACDIPLAVEVSADLEQTLAALSARLAELPADESGYLRLQLAGELPPLHQVAPLRFNYQPAGLASIAGEIERRVEQNAPSEYPIDWIVRERGDKLEIIIRHDRTLHHPDTIAGLLERWRAYISA
jgi:acyl transferase domain-containing protein/NAD(P)-dependent dehydrogenase (short-subunit alcohol dehydrogenase family)